MLLKDKLNDILIDLLNEETSTFKAKEEQNEMIQKINELKNFTLLEEENIKKEKTKGAIKEAKTAIYKTQKSVINNATKLY